MIEKNKEYILHTIAQGYEGEGIAKINGTFPIFIEGALKGEEVRVRIVKVKKQYAYGKLLEIISPSKERQEEECTHYKRCGGCSMQHQSYEGQLNFKWERVKDCISKIGGINDNIVKFPIGMGENPYRYRNKVQLPIGMVNGELSIGFYAPRSHNIVNMESCIIQDEVGEQVAKITKEWAKENSIMPTTIDGEWYEQGLLRHIMIRKGFTTNEVMVVLITRDKKIPKLDQWIELVKSNIKGIKSIILNINSNKTNVIMGTECVTLWGDDVIQDYIGEFKYNISPLSFFQVNPKQTEKLYNETLKQAGLTGSEIVFDAYCGTGSITLFLSKNAKKVYGVEIIEPAIINARENAKLNNIENAEFFVGKSEEIIPDLINKNIVPDIVVVDPPRKGCDEVLLQAISNVLPKKIVYVSCDPTTLARDLRILENTGYKTETVQPVDMFPHTSHIENVALLVKERRDVEK